MPDGHLDRNADHGAILWPAVDLCCVHNRYVRKPDAAAGVAHDNVVKMSQPLSIAAKADSARI